jgi:hypothetical protein
MKLVKFINYYKPQFQINQVYGFTKNESKYLVKNGFAIYLTEIEAPKEPLIELESELDINTQIDNKKPLKRTKKTLK